jgi:hypothetical protein
LSNGLVSASHLRQLDLHDNYIGDEGAISLAAALQGMHCLTFLSLEHNTQISNAGGLAIVKSLASNGSNNHSFAMKRLDLSWKDMDSVAGEALARMLVHLPYLRHLLVYVYHGTPRTNVLHVKRLLHQLVGLAFDGNWLHRFHRVLATTLNYRVAHKCFEIMKMLGHAPPLDYELSTVTTIIFSFLGEFAWIRSCAVVIMFRTFRSSLMQQTIGSM